MNRGLIGALCLSAFAFLAACGGSQPPIGTAMSQSRAIAQRLAHGKSWMLPETKNKDLLYVSTGHSVQVYAYPSLKNLGHLKGLDAAGIDGLCTNTQGDIFVTAENGVSASVIYKFKHGNDMPTAALSDPGIAFGCAVDPTTGNLAVTNISAPGSEFQHGNVAIYTSAQGSPNIYADANIYWYWWAAYDNNGNLYVDGTSEGNGYPLAVLPKGSSTFTQVTLNKAFNPCSLQWLNGDLMIGNFSITKGPEYIYDVQISGNSGTVIGQTALNSRGRNAGNAQFWIQGNRVVGPGRKEASLQTWSYPDGGDPIATIKGEARGAIISAAPSRLRARQ